MKYDIIIIGAGPGGIFSAYELVQQNPDLKIAVFEAGHPLEKRHCPIDGDKIKSCINCKSCSIMSGFGGAGAFSDGKYNITNDFGGTLYEYIGKRQALELMRYVDDINMRYGGAGTKLYSTAGTQFKKECIQYDLHLLDASVRHLGTDINYVVLENLYNYLKDKVDFCKVAEGLGCTAIRVTKKEEVAPAIEKAIALKAPVMIECMIPEDDKVFPMVPAGAPISEVFDGDDLKRQS